MYDNEVNKVYESYKERVTPYNVKVYGIDEACISAGYSYALTVGEMPEHANEHDLERAKMLGKAPTGSGEDKYLRFIHVDFDWCLPRYMWQEVDTYHFMERNSQGTVHRITKMNIKEMCSPYTSMVDIDNLNLLIGAYKRASSPERREIAWLKIKSNIPEGLMLASRVSTNYATLKTIYAQRKNHKNPEWHVFCNWIKTLPCARTFGLCGNE